MGYMERTKLLTALERAQASITYMLSIASANEGWHRRLFNKTGDVRHLEQVTYYQETLSDLKRQHAAVGHARLLLMPGAEVDSNE